MRFLPHIVPSLVAAVLATTTLTTSIAAACGGYVPVDPVPRVLAVSTHGVLKGERWTNRAFVVLEQTIKPEGNRLWELLAPGTYDSTRIKAMSRLKAPMEVTLVGPSGARVVKTDKQFALANAMHFAWNQTRIGLEVPLKPTEQFTIAIAGRAPDATWSEIEYHEATAATTWWLGQQGIKDAQYVGLRTIKGMAFDIVEYSQGSMTHFMVRDGDRTVGLAANGSVLGTVTASGRSFIVFNTDGQIGLLELPKGSSANAKRA